MFLFGWVGQLIPVTTGEDTDAIEDRCAPTAATSRTQKTGALVAEMTFYPIKVDRVAHISPGFAPNAVMVAQHDLVGISTHSDGGDDFTMP